jgi:hypothetical protein
MRSRALRPVVSLAVASTALVAVVVSGWMAKAAEIDQEPTVGLVNPATGEWHLRHRHGAVTSFYYGNPGDYPFMGDWDCDGVRSAPSTDGHLHRCRQSWVTAIPE